MFSLCDADGEIASAQGLKALYPEWGGQGAVEVVPADLVRLQPGEFLNDTIIDFYMRWGPSCQSNRADFTFSWTADGKPVQIGCPATNTLGHMCCLAMHLICVMPVQRCPRFEIGALLLLCCLSCSLASFSSPD